MKNVKKYLTAMLLVAAVAPVFTACDNGLEEFPRTIVSPPSDQFNAQIQFVSRLTDGKLAESDADYAALSNYLVTTLEGKKKSWLTVFDRADAGNLPKLMQMSLDTKRWTGFAFNRLVNKTTSEGSMMYFNTISKNIKGTPAGVGSNVTGVTVKMEGTRNEKNINGEIKTSTPVSFDIFFRTARFSTADQISALGGGNGVLNSLFYENMNFLMVGTVKNDLYDKLSETAQGVGNVAVTRVAQGPAYSIFLLADSRFWGFTGMTSSSLGGGIQAYTIEVMW